MSPGRRCDEGTSLVEFALAAPIFLFFLVGLIELGRFTCFAIIAANAARAGAQYGAQDLLTAYDSAGIATAAEQDGENMPNWTSGGGSVTVNQLCSSNGGPPQTCSTPWGASPPLNTIYYVQVTVTGVFTTLLNYPGIPNGIPISGSSTMRVATQ
jgi:Flp pilus assembly protein TadG